MANDFIALDGLGAQFIAAAEDIGGTGRKASQVVIPDGKSYTLGAKADSAWDGSAAAPSMMALAKYVALALADTTTPSPTADRVVVTGGSFNRPATTITYAQGQLVGNSGSAAAIAPIVVANASRVNGGGGVITGARLSKSTTGLTGASFRVHYFRGLAVADGNAHFVTSTGVDGATMSVNGIAAIHIGHIDVTMNVPFSDGAKGAGAPDRNVLAFVTDASRTDIYALIEARGAYPGVASETFALATEITYAV